MNFPYSVATATSAGTATDTAQSLTFARQALAQRASYNALVARAGTIKDSAATAVGETAVTPDSGATAGPAAAPTQAEKAAPQAEAPRAGSGEPATDSQKRSLKSVVDSAKEVSKQVIALGSRESIASKRVIAWVLSGAWANAWSSPGSSASSASRAWGVRSAG